MSGRVGVDASSVGQGLLAAAIVALAGHLATVPVWILTAITGICFYDLARRELTEDAGDATDWIGRAMRGGFLVVLAAGAWDNRDPASVAPYPGLLEMSGVAIILLGVELRRQTARAMGEHFTVKLYVDPEHRLIDGGPFRVLRHPSYAALLVMGVGTAVSVASPLALAATIAVWLPIVLYRIQQEERALEARFGAAYRDYSQRTWRLVPGVF